MPLESAGVWFDDLMHTGPSRPLRRQPRQGDPAPETVLYQGPDPAFDVRFLTGVGNSGMVTTRPRYLPRERQRQGAIVPEACLYQWPDQFDSSVFAGPGNGNADDSSQWFTASRSSPVGAFRFGRAIQSDPPEIDLGIIDLATNAGAGFGNENGWVAATANLRRVRDAAARRWSWSYPDRLPDTPQEMLVTITRTTAHSLPVPRRAGPSTPPAYLDPGEFFSIVAFDTGGTTRPTRGPTVRRVAEGQWEISVHIADPEITAHVAGDVVRRTPTAPRVSQHVTYARNLDSDLLGPLPATFTFSPQTPTRLPRGPLPATDGMLRELPDSTEAIQGVWESKPQPPARPIARTSQASSPMAREVWFAALEIEVLLPWDSVPTQAPVRRAARAPTEAAPYYTWSPVGDPMVWDVPPQPRRLPRPGPTPHEYTAAPPIYSSGISLAVSGPYYAVAGQIYTAGAIMGQAVSE